MSAITPSFVIDLETNMRLITQQEYGRLAANLWWNKLAKSMPSKSRKERITWLLDTAKIERTARGGGQAIFEDIVAQTVEYESENAAAGLELKKEQLEDLDGNGIDLATHWSRQIGAYAAYWPQKILAKAILANANSYDGVAFFSQSHPYNPFNTGAGTYSNDLTGSVSGVYPGAVPIHAYGSGNVAIDVAIQNIARALAYVASWKMPNGEDPRFLRATKLFYPPAMRARVVQMFNAKFISSSNTAGSIDIQAMVGDYGLPEPVEMPELGSAFGGSDTTYYLGTEDLLASELGAYIYIEREPFSVIYHGPMTDADLARVRKFQWTTEGRNTLQPGHPYLFIRCQGA